jgi:hypothetical protein
VSNPRATEIKAKRLLNLHRDDMKEKYGIEGSAVGYKTENGKFTDRIALIFYVKEKKSEQELSSQGISSIPREIEGIPTDVVVSKGFKPRR